MGRYSHLGHVCFVLDSYSSVDECVSSLENTSQERLKASVLSSPCEADKRTADFVFNDWVQYHSLVSTSHERGCHMWLGGGAGDGYGLFKKVRTNRIAAYLNTGVFGAVAMHSCDTPMCVNPKHVSWGTHKDNSEDRTRKGRWNHRYLFTPEVMAKRAAAVAEAYKRPGVLEARGLAIKSGKQLSKAFKELL